MDWYKSENRWWSKCEHCNDTGMIWGTPCGCQEEPEVDWRMKYLKLCHDIAMWPKVPMNIFFEVERGAAEYRDLMKDSDERL